MFKHSILWIAVQQYLLNTFVAWQAKEMVELSKSIANKIKDKQGDITEDEVRICKTQNFILDLKHIE